MTTRIAKTVMGVFVLDDGSLLETSLLEEGADPSTHHDLEDAYDAEDIVLPVEDIAAYADTSVEAVRERQAAAAREYTRDAIRDQGGRDALLVQAVRALDDLNEINNDLSERLRPWYAVHFPELSEKIDDNTEFAETIAEAAHREAQDADLSESSTGIDITPRDAEMIELFAKHLSEGYDVTGELETYVETLASEVAPNLEKILGGVLAARLISLAGSLEDLAKLPSSTIQVLGAEKAMFRHLKEGADAPKHGVLYQHPHVQQVPHDKAGTMSRFIANKAAIAARIDHFGGDFKGDSLRNEVDEKFNELKR